MKVNFIKILYYLRIFFFIIHYFLLFMIIGNVIKVGIFGYLFFIMEFIYGINVILELISKKKCYKNDLFYNIMQIGYFCYILVLWSKLYFNNVLLFNDMIVYLKTNYIILSILILFLVLYSRYLIGTQEK